ncbi:CG8349, partial [Drosophila busckii]
CALDNCGRELLEDALNARCNAYAPYSKFKVGAAFRAKCGQVFTGCNVENVAFTPTCCAERTALLKGISEGQTTYTAGAVVAYHPSGFTTPCGVCRQFIHEFAKRDMPIYIAQAPECDGKLPAFDDNDEVLVTSIFHLLPHSFTTY